MSTSGDLGSPVEGSVEPNLAFGDGGMGGGRYPNQFFDLSQQYMPPTIKELFRWCTFYFYNSPLIGSSIKKVSRYPITDLIIEDGQEASRNTWTKILTDYLKIKERAMEVNLDYHVYGNAFVSVHLPFTRFLKCQSCGNNQPIKTWDWSFVSSRFKFHGKCKQCKRSGELDVKDVPYKNLKDIRLIRWNPQNIHIKFNEYTGRYIYMYSVPFKLKTAITRGDKDILEDIPLILLEAVKKRRLVRLHPDSIKHLKNPTLAEQDQGWGKPTIIHVLKDMYYLYTLRRAQEAIALEHIIPFDMIYPMPNAQQDPYIHTDLADWRREVQNIIRKRRRDPNFKAVIPVPVGFQRVGGDGKALLLSPEMNYLTQTIVGGMGIPQEFLFGGLNFCLVKSTLCTTSKGLLRMDELCPDDIETREADFSVLSKDGVERAALVHHTAKRKQVKVRTKSGLTLTGSPIHRVWTIDGEVQMNWKELQNFKPGDAVALKKPEGLWGEREVAPELCRLLGYLVSEGTVTGKRISFGNSDDEILDDYLDCFEAQWGKRPAKQFKDLSEKYPGALPYNDTQSDDPEAKEFLRSIDMEHRSHGKQVPRIIREGKKEVVAEFLSALFSGDGCIVDTDKKQGVHYNSASERLIEEVQLLLMNFGILSSRYPPYPKDDEGSFGGVNNSTHSLQIRSEYVSLFMEEIGFTTERKNKLYREECSRESFRCEANKIPYVMDKLKSLRDLQNGCGAWIKENKTLELKQETYTTKEVADILDRDVSSVLLYIRNGKLSADREERSDGRFSTYFIKRDALLLFLDSYGTQKRAAVGQTTWELTDNNYERVNWDGVKTLDPVLYDRVREAKEADHWWDTVEEVSFLDEEVEMCDLTVHNTPSYVANGIISHNTGSSISLRTLENDFVQNRSQLLDLVLWIKDKIRSWTKLPDVKTIRFSDFRMADDIQRNQQLVGLNAQGKLSNQTMLTELGFDYEEETKKILEETHVQNYIMHIQSKGAAKSQGESQLTQFNYQQKVQELAERAQLDAQKRVQDMRARAHIPSNVGGNYSMDDVRRMQTQSAAGPEAGVEASLEGMPAEDQGALPPAEGEGAGVPPAGVGNVAGAVDAKIESRVQNWARQLSQHDENTARAAIARIKMKTPAMGAQIEQEYNKIMGAMVPESPMTDHQEQVGQQQVAKADQALSANMAPMPEQRASTRAGVV